MFRRFHRRPSRRRQRPCLLVERLEDRWVPATTASYSAGVLTISGDSLNSEIDIQQNSLRGSYTVTAFDNGVAASITGGVNNSSTFNQVNSIVVNTGLGSDTIQLSGSSAGNGSLSGNLTITSNNDVTVNIGTDVSKGPSGFVAANSFQVSGPTSIQNTGNGNLTAYIGGSGTSLGDLNLQDSGSGYIADFFSEFNGPSSITGNLTTNHTGAEDDFFQSGTSIGGYVSLNGTGSTAFSNVAAINTTIGGFFSDSASDFFINFDQGPLSSIGGNVFATSTTSADDSLELNSVSVQGNILEQGQGFLTFGLGHNAPYDAPTRVTGWVSINATGPDSSVFARVGSAAKSTRVDGFFSVVSDGTASFDNNVIKLGKARLGPTALSLAGTDNMVSVNGKINGDFTVSSAATDVLSVRLGVNPNVDTTVTGDVTVSQAATGGSTPTLTMKVGNRTSPTSLGGLNIPENGTSADTVTVTNTTVNGRFVRHRF
jgi:hypothetical protein